MGHPRNRSPAESQRYGRAVGLRLWPMPCRRAVSSGLFLAGRGTAVYGRHVKVTDMFRSGIRLLCLFLAVPLTALPGICAADSALESLKQTYEKSAEQLAGEQRARRTAALTAFGTALDNKAAALRKAGELDAFLAVDEEIKRFRTNPTVPEAAAQNAVVDAVRKAYRNTVERLGRSHAEQRVKLLRQYVADLTAWQRKRMQADDIDDARAGDVVKDAAEFELAETEAHLAGLPSPPRPPPRRPVVSKPAKPAGSREFKGHHYKVVHKTRVSWEQGRQRCEELGGHLAVLQTTDELNFVATMLGGAPAWIGCRYNHDHKKWRWVTGNFIHAPLSSIGPRYAWTRFARMHPGVSGDTCMLLRGSGAVERRSNSGIKRGWRYSKVNLFVCEWDD
jgi:hypothetical protein